jgi:hypothetical protein
MLVIGVVSIPTVSAQEESKYNVTAEEAFEHANANLSVDEAREIATFYLEELSGTIPEFSEWKDAIAEYDIAFYDMHGDITAYSFDVMKNKEYDGYIIISATKDKFPILEFSKGQLPNEIPKMVKKSQNEIENYANKNKLNVEESIPIYEGPTFYYNQYSLQDNKNGTKKKVIVDLVTSNIISEENESSFNRTDKVRVIENKKIKEAWYDLESRITGKTTNVETVSSKSPTVKMIVNVPFEAWYLGCAPTSATMVLEYWDEHGYSNLPSGHTLIQELATAMDTNTTTGSTVNRKIAVGIETVCENHQYTNFESIFDSSLSMSEAMTEINAVRPFVLSMENGGVGSGYPSTSPYGNHSVTCIGYYDGTTTDTLFIHDTWDTSQSHGITFGSWDHARATWVRP